MRSGCAGETLIDREVRLEHEFPAKRPPSDVWTTMLCPVGHCHCSAEGEWMSEDFVPFVSNLDFPIPETESGKIILKKDNPSGLPELDESIEAIVRFKRTTYLAGESCQVDDDCKTPIEFAIRSSCPYEAQCIENKCTVVCPDF